MDKKNIILGAALSAIIALTQASMVFLGKEHLATQILEVVANAGCQIAKLEEKQ